MDDSDDEQPVIIIFFFFFIQCINSTLFSIEKYIQANIWIHMYF